MLLTDVRSEFDSGLDTFWLLKKMVLLSAGREKEKQLYRKQNWVITAAKIVKAVEKMKR